jgi:hypothetical protein
MASRKVFSPRWNPGSFRKAQPQHCVLYSIFMSVLEYEIEMISVCLLFWCAEAALW